LNGANEKPSSTTASKPASTHESTSSSSLFLVLLATLYLTHFAAEGCLLPFLPVYYHSLGHGGSIIGVLGAATPLTTFLVAPLWGQWADKTGQPIHILYVTMFLSMIGQTLVLVSDDAGYIMTMLCLRTIFSAPVKPLIDSVVMEELTRQGQAQNFGKIRFWSILSTGVAMSLAGELISAGTTTTHHQQQQQQQYYDNFGDSSNWRDAIFILWQSLTGYRLLFLVHALLHIPTFVSLRAVEILRTRSKQNVPPTTRGSGSTNGTSNSKETTKPESVTTSRSSSLFTAHWQNLRQWMEQDSKATFFFLVFLMGVAASICENFAYVRIQEVGGTASTMGLSRLFCSLAGAPTFYLNGRLLQHQKMSTQPHVVVNRVMTLCFFCITVRFLIFWGMQTPYWSLLAESLRGIIFAVFWATCTVYISNHISSPGGRSTMVSWRRRSHSATRPH
jgi:MFS family permease